MSGLTEAPEIKDELTGKWEEMLDWPETRDRVMIQNYYTGRIRLVKPNQIQMMTGRIRHKDKNSEYDVPPVWRKVNDGEKKVLWKAEIQLEFAQHQAVLARHFYNKHNYDVMRNGGINKDMDLIDDIQLRKKAIQANRAADKRDKEKEKARRYAKKGGMLQMENRKLSYAGDDIGEIGRFLMAVAVEHRKARDIEEIGKKEKSVFEQEEMRERARESVKSSRTKKKE